MSSLFAENGTSRSFIFHLTMKKLRDLASLKYFSLSIPNDLLTLENIYKMF